MQLGSLTSTFRNQRCTFIVCSKPLLANLVLLLGACSLMRSLRPAFGTGLGLSWAPEDATVPSAKQEHSLSVFSSMMSLRYEARLCP